MQKDFLGFIKKHALIGPGDKVLLAVSGGIDSVVMAHLFQGLEVDMDIAHCNFQLRDEESEQDAEFVSGLSNDLGVNFHLKHFNTKDFAKENGISIQMAARELRYEWFYELCGSFGYTKIASAHHKNDNVETLVHNLIRGTSISGLRGMLPQNGEIIRPLLFASRAELHEYASDKGITWREDSSNVVDEYKRNFIRHQILPDFKKMNPNYLEVIDASMKKNLEVEQIFKNQVEHLKEHLIEKISETRFSLSIGKLKEKSIGPYVLSEMLGHFGFNYSQCQSIINKMNGHVGKQFEAKEFVLTIDRKSIFIDSSDERRDEGVWIHTETKVHKGASNLYFETLNGDAVIDRDLNRAFLDFDRLKFPLYIRKWEEGDTFVPLGMSGKKKISDFMIDSKIPLNLKKEQQVVLSEDKVVWVVGKRIDDRFKVTDSTRNIFLITLDNAHV